MDNCTQNQIEEPSTAVNRTRYSSFFVPNFRKHNASLATIFDHSATPTYTKEICCKAPLLGHAARFRVPERNSITKYENAAKKAIIEIFTGAVYRNRPGLIIKNISHHVYILEGNELQFKLSQFWLHRLT